MRSDKLVLLDLWGAFPFTFPLSRLERNVSLRRVEFILNYLPPFFPVPLLNVLLAVLVLLLRISISYSTIYQTSGGGCVVLEVYVLYL